MVRVDAIGELSPEGEERRQKLAKTKKEKGGGKAERWREPE